MTGCPDGRREGSRRAVNRLLRPVWRRLTDVQGPSTEPREGLPPVHGRSSDLSTSPFWATSSGTEPRHVEFTAWVVVGGIPGLSETGRHSVCSRVRLRRRNSSDRTPSGPRARVETVGGSRAKAEHSPTPNLRESPVFGPVGVTGGVRTDDTPRT